MVSGVDTIGSRVSTRDIARDDEEDAVKVYERTENGTTTHVSIKDAMAEVNEAMMGPRRNIREMSSGRTGHWITYRDGRKVTLILVDAPESEDEPAPDAWTVASHKMLLHRFTAADETGRAVCNKSYRPWRYGNGYTFRTKAEQQAHEYADLYRFCPKCEAK